VGVEGVRVREEYCILLTRVCLESGYILLQCVAVCVVVCCTLPQSLTYSHTYSYPCLDESLSQSAAVHRSAIQYGAKLFL